MKVNFFTFLFGIITIATILSCTTPLEKNNKPKEVIDEEWITAVVFRNRARTNPSVIDNLIWLNNDDFLNLTYGSYDTPKWRALHFAEKGDTIVYRRNKHNLDCEIKEFKPYNP